MIWPNIATTLMADGKGLFTATGAAEFISGVILHDETIRQKSSGGTPLVQVLSSQGRPGTDGTRI